ARTEPRAPPRAHSARARAPASQDRRRARRTCAKAAGGTTVRDRVALVPGGARGIGKATVRALVDRGARVPAVSRTESELEALADELPVEVLAESVATEDGCVRIVEETRRRLGPVEILVNNA